jgi:hypothetical protein
VIVCQHFEHDSARVGDGMSGFNCVAPGGGAPLTPPAGPLTLAGQDDRHPLWLLRQQCVDGGQLVLSRSTVDHWTWWVRVPIAGLWPVDQTHLEEGKVICTTTDVAAHGREETRQQGRTQLWLLVREGIGQNQCIPS